VQTPLNREIVQISTYAIIVTFLDQSVAMLLQLRITCEQLDWKLSLLTQICNHFPPFLFHVENLFIRSTQPTHCMWDGVASEQWTEHIRAFGGAKDLHITGVHVTDILGALRPAQGPADGSHAAETLFPALHNLHLEEDMRVGMPL
jgi:hypothetical protein